MILILTSPGFFFKKPTCLYNFELDQPMHAHILSSDQILDNSQLPSCLKGFCVDLDNISGLYRLLIVPR